MSYRKSLLAGSFGQPPAPSTDVEAPPASPSANNINRLSAESAQHQHTNSTCSREQSFDGSSAGLFSTAHAHGSSYVGRSWMQGFTQAPPAAPRPAAPARQSIGFTVPIPAAATPAASIPRPNALQTQQQLPSTLCLPGEQHAPSTAPPSTLLFGSSPSMHAPPTSTSHLTTGLAYNQQQQLSPSRQASMALAARCSHEGSLAEPLLQSEVLQGAAVLEQPGPWQFAPAAGAGEPPGESGFRASREEGLAEGGSSRGKQHSQQQLLQGVEGKAAQGHVRVSADGASGAAGPARDPAASAMRVADGGNLKAMVFGLINGAVGLPALIAFAAIVFQAPIYAPQLGALCKMFFLSSALHQLVFCLLSTLPFAVGQVQDVGLIFLSAMASSIAGMCAAAGLPGSVALGTSLLTLSVSTTIVGVLTTLVGRYRLATLVNYVPLPVVGGYLGYVGYFCIAGGIALGTSTIIGPLSSWGALLAAGPLTKLAPTLATAFALMATLEHCSHPLALPSMLLAIPLAFHAVLALSGLSLQDAMAAGWVMQPPPDGNEPFWRLWGLFNMSWHDGRLAGIYWPAMWAQGPKLVGLFLVVCFGSCMDVAAIQQDMPLPMDFNRELTTVGVSNCIVGLVGAGYTGSYIFSQTVFTMRAGVFNRLNGLVVALMELFVFAVPFSVVQYCPSFFFGALLLWFGVEICRDWLVLSHRKLSMPEYCLLWLTFALIMALGLELGIAAGICAATLYFAYEYAASQVAALHQVAASSGTAHSYDAARLLDLMALRHAAVRLSGYVFFGSSLALTAKVEEIASKLLRDVSDLNLAADAALAQHQEAAELQLAAAAAAAAGASPPPTPAAPLLPRPAPSSPAKMQSSKARGGATRGRGRGRAGKGEEGRHAAPGQQKQAEAAPQLPSVSWAEMVRAMADAPLFIVLDCRHVSHVDATGARTFGSLSSSLGARGVRLLFAGLDPKAQQVRKLLQAHGVSLRAGPEVVVADMGTLAAAAAWHHERQPQQDGVWEFWSLAAAVAHIERAYLAAALSRGLLPLPSARVGLQEVLTSHADELPLPLPEVAALASCLAQYFTTRRLASGEVLLREGQEVEELLLVEQGFLQLHLSAGTDGTTGADGTPSAAAATLARSDGFGYPLQLREGQGASSGKEVPMRTSQYGPGCFVAAHEFFLHRPAAATATAVAVPTTTSTAAALPPAATSPGMPAHAPTPGSSTNSANGGGGGCAAAGAGADGRAEGVCSVLCLSRARFQAALQEAPAAVAVLQWAALRSVCLDLTAALDLMERNSAM